MSYKDWEARADRVCQRYVGLSLFDLPDSDTWNAWDSDQTPGEFVKETVATVMEEMGF
jgi:hypothetical protein